MDLADAASYHQLVLNTEGRSPQTIRLYLLYERRFLEYLAHRGIPADLDALNSVNVRQALLWVQQSGHGKRGGAVAARTFVNVLKTWASFLEREGVWADSPLRRIRRVKVIKLERQPFTRTEVLGILGACDGSRTPERDRFLIQLLLDTGARIGELCGMHVSDIDLGKRQARVLGKGGRERSIPIGVATSADGGPLFRSLRQWLRVRDDLTRRRPERAGERLFLTPSSYPLTAAGAGEIIGRLGDRAGIPHATPHQFRHTFCTIYLTQFPGDELGLRRIVGHLSRDVLADYVHLASQEIARRAGQVAPTHHWLNQRGG